MESYDQPRYIHMLHIYTHTDPHIYIHTHAHTHTHGPTYTCTHTHTYCDDAVLGETFCPFCPLLTIFPLSMWVEWGEIWIGMLENENSWLNVGIHSLKFYPFCANLEKILWRREWLPTPVLFPGEFHGQRSLVKTDFSLFGLKNSES